MRKRVFLVVIDGFGIGTDAEDRADSPNSLKSIYDTSKLNIPFLRVMGLFNIEGMNYGRRSCIVCASFGRCARLNKDHGRRAGYYELAGSASADADKSTILDALTDAGKKVIAIGDVKDIFGERAVTEHIAASSNKTTVEALIKAAKTNFEGLCIADIGRIDMIPEEKRNIRGYASVLNYIDRRINQFTHLLRKGDVLIITGDRGIDPTHKNDDDAEQYLPLMITGSEIRPAINLGTRSSLADTAASILDYFEIENNSDGESYLPEIIKNESATERETK